VYEVTGEAGRGGVISRYTCKPLRGGSTEGSWLRSEQSTSKARMRRGLACVTRWEVTPCAHVHMRDSLRQATQQWFVCAPYRTVYCLQC
jgi:hypothetical protein